MTTEKQLEMSLLNHNAFTKGIILDLDSCGAGGHKEHLILFNTQSQVSYLKTKTELDELIDSISNIDDANGMRFEEPNPLFYDEYNRLKNGGKVDQTFMYDMRDIVDETIERRYNNKAVTGAELRELNLLIQLGELN